MMEFLILVLTSGVVGGAVSAGMTGGFGMRRDRLSRRHAQSASALDALKELQDAYGLVRNRQRTADAFEPAETAFLAEIDKCGDEDLSQSADALKATGRLYAASDPDSGTEVFETAVDGLRESLRNKMRKLN